MDLFQAPAGESLPLRDADLWLYREIDLGAPPGQLLRELVDATPWRCDPITLWGKTYPQPRLVAWYGEPGLRYTYSRITMEAIPWTDALQKIKARVEALSGSAFNSVLLNYYRDQRDSMGFHADDEPELGQEPVIASLSLGAERTLVFRHRHRRNVPDARIPLPSGSLLLMRGATQSCWKHGIRKSTKPTGPRLNLTFRRILMT